MDFRFDQSIRVSDTMIGRPDTPVNTMKWKRRPTRTQASQSQRSRPTGGEFGDGPETEFEIGGVWYFGVGMDARLGANWRLGASFSGIGMATRFSGDGITGALEGGLYLGYNWKPAQSLSKLDP